jgi:GNAT superfamily N-acetyltransferase
VALTPEVAEGPLRGAHLDQATDIAVRAFDDDPFFSYLFPDPDQRHRAVGRLHRSVLHQLGGHATTRTAFLDGKVVGVAMWVPPKGWPYPVRLQFRQMLSALHAFLPDVGALGRAGSILRAVQHAHPKAPQWYLQLLMVDPDVQRQGIGGLLQAPTLAVCDEQGLPAWVETQKEENLAYYGRFGFKVIAEHHTVTDGPSMWSLSREPKA